MHADQAILVHLNPKLLGVSCKVEALPKKFILRSWCFWNVFDETGMECLSADGRRVANGSSCLFKKKTRKMNSEHICHSGGSFSSFPTRRGHRRMLASWVKISSAKFLSTFRIHSRFCSRFHFCWTCTMCWCLIHTSIAELKMARISVLFDPSFYTCTNIVSEARFATSYGVSDQMASRFVRATCRKLKPMIIFRSMN